jgi:hypothetical protein
VPDVFWAELGKCLWKAVRASAELSVRTMLRREDMRGDRDFTTVRIV